jgi:hypothetical protein
MDRPAVIKFYSGHRSNDKGAFLVGLVPNYPWCYERKIFA